MPGLQDWIHKLEVGEGVRYLKWALVVLGLLGLTVVYDIREFRNFSTLEAMDSAQVARNLAEGRGFSTDFIRPLSILVRQRQMAPGIPVLKEPNHPDLMNPPVYPAVLAGLMKILPFQFDVNRTSFRVHQPEVLIAGFNQLLFFLSILMVHRLGRRLFDPAVGWMAAVVFAGADLFWRFSVSGLSTMLLVVLVLGLVGCLVSLEQSHREERGSDVWFIATAAACGLLVGLAGLTRYSLVCLILPVVAFLALYFGRRRVVLALSALVAFSVVMAPWLVRNHQVSGHVFGLAGYAVHQGTDIFPGNRLERFLKSSFDEEVTRVTFDKVVRKTVVNTGEILRDELPRLGGSWISALFLVSLLIPFRNPALSRIRVFIVLALPVLILAQAVGRTHLTAASPEVNSENLLVVLAPVAFIFGAGIFFILLDQMELSLPPLRPVIAVGFAVAMCLPLALTLLPPRSFPFAWPPYWPPRIQDVGSWMEKDEMVMSDMPWAVAWYGNRQCLWVTLDAPTDAGYNAGSDFFAIYDYQKPVSGLYLTAFTTDARFFPEIIKSPEHAWGKFMLDSFLKSNVPTGFPLKNATPGFVKDGQLFLSDRPRWKARPTTP